MLAAGLADMGHRVIGVDVSETLVAELCAGILRIQEPGLADLVAEGVASGRLLFTTSYAYAVPQADVIFLAVDTPQTLGGRRRPAQHPRRHPVHRRDPQRSTSPIIVNKSTSPIGTGETIEEILSEALDEQHRRPRIVSNPEFLRQGHAVRGLLPSRPDRRRFAQSRDDARDGRRPVRRASAASVDRHRPAHGRDDQVRRQLVPGDADLVHQRDRPPVRSDRRRASTRSSTGIAHDPRIGDHFFHPGIGFGGSCLPKDVAALRYIGETFGVATPVLSAVQDVDRRTADERRPPPAGAPRDARGQAPSAVWGLTFKGGTEDTRESPAMDVVSLLRNEGAIDPGVRPRGDSADPRLVPERSGSLVRSDSALEAVRDADALADPDRLVRVPVDPARRCAAKRCAAASSSTAATCSTRAQVEAEGLAYMGVGRTPTALRRRSTDR